ncbi:hypothetical protein EXIGLDRAFT_431392 [Exidia glandulosa HHB12029]|uniref:Uncharacterized protein n=1 Tax=Exidia glandulosa HHB12029 TaxID=1314781 RepID=A0A165Z7T4_EXIGL|nr:hypothetical protein EXIGLDRAFT_431392 [Exidia glandulosa HHB12029]
MNTLQLDFNPTAGSSTEPPPLPPLDRRVLQLSTLLWHWESGNHGRPHTVTEDVARLSPDPMAVYLPGPTARLAFDFWSPEHRAFVYKLPENAPVKLRYTRRTLIGIVDLYRLQMEELGAVCGVYGSFDDPDDFATIGPKLVIHPLSTPAFHAELSPVPLHPSSRRRSANRRGPAPPYDFFESDWMQNKLGPALIGKGRAINVNPPELPGQSDNDLKTKGEYGQPDAVYFKGFGGEWIGGLLQKKENGEDLGSRTEVKWLVEEDSGEDAEGANWGVELEFQVRLVSISQSLCLMLRRFQPVDLDKSWLDEAGEAHLQAYTVDATVKRVFVKAPWFDENQHLEEDERLAASRTLMLIGEPGNQRWV